jgi:polyhydroxyalkanoate synthesis regulator phasin
MAAQFGRMDVISALLLNNCDASIKDDGGWDAAQLAESEEQTEARYILEDWAENEAATRAKLEQESMLKKAEAGTATMASEIRSEMEKMVKDMMTPMQEDIDALRGEMDTLADALREETERSEKAQSEIMADLDALSGKVVTQAEFDELADRATAPLQSDLSGVKSRLNDLTRRVGAMQMEGLQAGFDSLGSPH